MNRTIATVGLVAFLIAMWWAEVALALHASPDPSLETAAGRPYAFSVRGSLGLLEGEAGELVYEPAIDYDYKLSELQWDLSGVVMGGVVASGVSGKWGYNAGVWIPVTQGDGEMKDYDWLVPGMDWTDYHRSEVDVESGYTIDFNLNYLFFQRSTVGARALVGYKRDYWEWSDRGQEFIYSEYAFRDFKGNFGGMNVIDYEQTFDIPYLGVNLDGKAGKLAWNAYALYSPFVSAEDEDHHILRELHFEGSFEGGDFFAAGVSGTYRLNGNMFVNVAAEYQDIAEIRGDSYIVETGESYSDGAGISNSHMVFSAAVGWQL